MKAIIRKEDIRERDVDNVDIYKCFRPGDIILSRVIGLSDNGYLLTTASSELGVVLARSEFGKLTQFRLIGKSNIELIQVSQWWPILGLR